ncbi:MAG: hydroxyacid dehydrogenase [Deltaproteobacteria bacterium]|nr:hydroxyacid dehydrogenase [Deltaproteobacteria bacterium]
MERYKILITDHLVGQMPEIVKQKYPGESEKIEWVMAEKGDKEELCGLVRGVDILVGARHAISAKILEKADNVYFIQQCSAGYDNIDLQTTKAKGITVSNSGSAGVIPVAEHAIMLMLACAKSLPRAHNSMVKGEWIFPQLINKVYELYEKTLGIIGLGKIGTQLATLANGFKMKIQYFDPYREDTSDLDFSVKAVSLDELLRTSDFVSIHTLLTEETRHMIGTDQLLMMKPTAYIVNTSRGLIVDEDALADALENGTIAGAGLDVFGGHHEPPPDNAKILGLSNVVLTPHFGGATAEDIYRNFYVTSLDNIIRVLRGEKPLYVVSEGKI